MIWSIITPYLKIEVYKCKKLDFVIKVCLTFFKNNSSLLVNFYGSVPWFFNKNVLRGNIKKNPILLGLKPQQFQMVRAQ